jgi:malate/lactate dehydrogenase
MLTSLMSYTVAIIGTGRIGSATAFCLADHPHIKELLLINRTQKNAEGLKADLMGTFPERGNVIRAASLEEAGSADIILLTLGIFGSPTGENVWGTNEAMIRTLFSQWKPKANSIIVVITSPPDKAAHLVYRLSGLEPRRVIGFGGQLDVKRLQYLLAAESGNFSHMEDVHYIGEHGKRGIPLFTQEVSDSNAITRRSKHFFLDELADYGAATFCTARELALLTNMLMQEQESVAHVSSYHADHDLFIQWPYRLNRSGIIGQVALDLSAESQTELDRLIITRKQEIDF